VRNCPPPYRPLRGAAPPHFVDRPDANDFDAGGVRAASLAAYMAGPQDPRFHRLVVSEPAMGKTALLRAIGQRAVLELDWAVAVHRCQAKERLFGAVAAAAAASLQRQWPAESGRLARRLVGPWARRARAMDRGPHPAGRDLVKAPLCLAPEADVSWAELRQTLFVGGRFAQSLSRGLLLVFDDADRLGGTEVESLGHLARHLSQEGLPVAVLLSGGLHLAERFYRLGNFSATVWPTRLGALEPAEACEALAVPALDRRVDFEEEALELACWGARGRPLQVQRLGFAAWSTATDGGPVTVSDVEEAMGLIGSKPAA